MVMGQYRNGRLAKQMFSAVTVFRMLTQSVRACCLCAYVREKEREKEACESVHVRVVWCPRVYCR